MKTKELKVGTVRERADREEMSARLTIFAPGATDLYRADSHMNVTIAREDLKAPLDLAEGTK